jgi:two-component system, chemotaxis family, protein-glutamate methylesterase/glutaminase
MSRPKYLVVVGASAGGLKTMSELFSKVDPELDAAFVAVLHLSKHSLNDVLVHTIQKNTDLNCRVAGDGMPLENGTVYLAPANHHVLVWGDSLKLSNGPTENNWRPSIDVLFRSAAASFNSRAVGIVLTGLLDDGTSGMGAIKRCGGITIVQEPAEAEFDSMPKNVIRNVEVDYRVPVSDIPYILKDLDSKPAPPPAKVPNEVRIEAEITARMNTLINPLPEIGTHSNYTCPDCGGNLWRLNGDVVSRFRCHTGHVYTREVLLKKQDEMVEESLWTAIRMLEERRNLLQTAFENDKKSGSADIENQRYARAQEYENHVRVLKSLLVTIGNSGNIPVKTVER